MLSALLGTHSWTPRRCCFALRTTGLHIILHFMHSHCTQVELHWDWTSVAIVVKHKYCGSVQHMCSRGFTLQEDSDAERRTAIVCVARAQLDLAGKVKRLLEQKPRYIATPADRKWVLAILHCRFTAARLAHDPDGVQAVLEQLAAAPDAQPDMLWSKALELHGALLIHRQPTALLPCGQADVQKNCRHCHHAWPCNSVSKTSYILEHL